MSRFAFGVPSAEWDPIMKGKSPRDRRLRGIFENRKAGSGSRNGRRYIVAVCVKGRKYCIRACSKEEAVFIRYQIESTLDCGHRAGNWNWSEFCFPDMQDDTYVDNGYISLCGRSFRMRTPWTEWRSKLVAAGWWFSFCKRPPHACVVRVAPETGDVRVSRIPLARVIGPFREIRKPCKNSRRERRPQSG